MVELGVRPKYLLEALEHLLIGLDQVVEGYVCGHSLNIPFKEDTFHGDLHLLQAEEDVHHVIDYAHVVHTGTKERSECVHSQLKKGFINHYDDRYNVTLCDVVVATGLTLVNELDHPN